jgi:hypothetical protein
VLIIGCQLFSGVAASLVSHCKLSICLPVHPVFNIRSALSISYRLLSECAATHGMACIGLFAYYIQTTLSHDGPPHVRHCQHCVSYKIDLLVSPVARGAMSVRHKQKPFNDWSIHSCITIGPVDLTGGSRFVSDGRQATNDQIKAE